MTPIFTKLPRAEVSAAPIPAPAQLESFKAALREVVGRATAKERLSCNEHVGLAIVSSVEQRDNVLLPNEAMLLSPGVCARKRIEFGLGRMAARLAMEAIGYQQLSGLTRGKEGQPLWPEGITGSITHCYPWNVAVVARSSDGLAMGVDLENLDRMEGPDISNLICHATELVWVRSGGNSRERLGMIFSAKEALYKALYPFCRRYIDFKEVELSWSPEQSCFLAQVVTAGEFRADRPLKVHCRRHESFIFSVVIHKPN